MALNPIGVSDAIAEFVLLSNQHKMSQLVAVYGSLKKGFGNHMLLADAPLIATGFAKGWNMYSLSYYPMIIPGDGDVQVEIYQVTKAEMDRLDALEGYPDYYNRKITYVTTSMRVIQAWIYYGRESQVKGRREVVSGIWTPQDRRSHLALA
jgi:gamma-glutamylcyclotransferase (GGCT)/AIG2-like uncharacterized protein YtfP